jgi:hypothetical protein
MNTDHAHVRERRDVRDAYGIALLALAVSTVVLIASGAPVSSPAAAFSVLLQVLALTVAMRVSGASRRVFVLALVGTAVILSAGVIGAALGGMTGALAALVAWFGLVMIAIFGIARRLATFERVTLPLVLGLLCIYLLIGHAFGLAYNISNTVGPPAFSEAQPGVSGSVYFSFITLATVGYGDITPVSPVARSIAVMEAIFGQLYLVSIVSLAVGRIGTERLKRPSAEEDDAG